MIGQFWFSEAAPSEHVVLQLSWKNGSPEGTVISPPDVISSLERQEIPARSKDEAMQLGIALGYAVMVSSLSQTPLTLSGDCTAWPSVWGSLKTRSVVSFDRARAH